MAMDQDRKRAFDAQFEQELKTFVTLCESEDTQVYALSIAMGSPKKNADGDIEYAGSVYRHHSTALTSGQAHAVQLCLEREIKRIKEILES